MDSRTFPSLSDIDVASSQQIDNGSTNNALATTFRVIPTADLVSPSFSNFTQTKLATDRTLSVFIDTSGGPVDIGGGPYGAQVIQALPIASDIQNFFVGTLTRLASLINLNFQVVSDSSQAEIDLFLDKVISIGGSGTTLGISLENTSKQRNWWELVLNGTALSSNSDYLRYALIHELGHSLGLKHPFDNSEGSVFISSDPAQSAYPEETVMAYRDPMNGSWPTWYTDNDLAALYQIWGKKDLLSINLSGPQYPTYNISNTYALGLLSGRVAAANTVISGNTYDYQFFNLGSARYGLGLRGQNQIDEITGASSISFNDKTLSLASDVASVFNQINGKDDVTGVVFRLYNAAFSRLPDSNGLKNWINGNTSGGQTYASSAKEFAASQEFINRYGSNTTDTQYITTLYNNVLERSPDASGLAHYQSLLSSGSKSRGDLLLDFSESPENRVLFTRVTGLA